MVLTLDGQSYIYIFTAENVNVFIRRFCVRFVVLSAPRIQTNATEMPPALRVMFGLREERTIYKYINNISVYLCISIGEERILFI